MTTIATICARGGSTGLPGKNIRPLLGKPLIAHTIELALSMNDIDRVVVSTDSEEIGAVAREWGAEVPFRRPDHLATAEAAKLPVIAHLIDALEAEGAEIDRIVDLDPTSPLRTRDDVATCMAMLDAQTDCVITAYPAEKNPYFNMVEIEDGRAVLSKRAAGGVVARQQAPAVYAMNASIYVWHRHTLTLGLWEGRTRLHVMPRERSIDVDSLIDFRLVEMLMEMRDGG